MRLSLRKAAHAVLSTAAQQEIRVRSGRDDIYFANNEEVSPPTASKTCGHSRYTARETARWWLFMILLTRKAEFSSSHYYWSDQLSPEENVRLFGKCANRNGHGHNYTLEVTVEGEVDPVSGFVVDLKELKE